MENSKEKNVIFVCTGNTCRSPMAEAIFRYEAKRRGLAVSVCSAGTEASAGGRIHMNSLRTLSNHGLSIENFTSTQLTMEMISSALAVICMTESQKEIVAYSYAKHKGIPIAEVGSVYAYSDFCGYSIPDPYGYPIEAYESTYTALEGGMSAIIEKLFAETKEQTAEETTKKKPRKTSGGARKRAEGAKKSGEKSASSGKRKTATRKSEPKKENDL